MSLEARIFESVFGDDGLLVRQTRMEGTLADVLRIATEARDELRRINGTVHDLVAYRDELPSADRATLVGQFRAHLAEEGAAAERGSARRRGIAAIVARLAYDALKLGAALLLAYIALHLGLPANVIRTALGF